MQSAIADSLLLS